MSLYQEAAHEGILHQTHSEETSPGPNVGTASSYQHMNTFRMNQNMLNLVHMHTLPTVLCFPRNSDELGSNSCISAHHAWDKGRAFNSVWDFCQMKWLEKYRKKTLHVKWCH